MELLLHGITNNGNEFEVYRRADDNFLTIEIDPDTHEATSELHPCGIYLGEFLLEFLRKLKEVDGAQPDFIKEIYGDLYENEFSDFYDFLKKFDLFGMFC